MPSPSKHPVIWEGVVVGEVDDISCDNFNVFGRWYPANTDATAKFYEQLRHGRELRISVGSLEGIIDTPPDAWVEMTASS